MHHMRQDMADLTASAATITLPGSLPAGTVVLTMNGAQPVEQLMPGDRIVTRAGMRILRGLARPAPDAYRLEFDGTQVIYTDGGQLYSDTCAPFRLLS